MKVCLKLNHSGSILEHMLNEGEMIAVGRSSKCDLNLDDEQISGRHCRIHLKRDRLEIQDLDSKNGTYLNGIRIEHSEVFVGDEIRIGETIISCEENKTDPEAMDALTFPGPFKDRISYELKADFTGARIQNQLANKRLSVVPKVNYQASQDKEIDVRKKVQSNIKLSKQEIRSKNKIKSIFATGLDAFALILMLFVPLWIVTNFVPATATKDQKMNFLLILEVGSCLMFLLLNFKMAKFTLGEKLVGIQRLYSKQ